MPMQYVVTLLYTLHGCNLLHGERVGRHFVHSSERQLLKVDCRDVALRQQTTGLVEPRFRCISDWSEYERTGKASERG